MLGALRNFPLAFFAAAGLSLLALDLPAQEGGYAVRQGRRVFVHDANYDKLKIAPYTLEDPLVFADGREVSTIGDWQARRREILALFSHEMFGAEPPRPEALVTELADEKRTVDGHAIRRQYRMWFKADKSGPCVSWIVWIPSHAKGPVPVISFLNYGGNHELVPDADIPVQQGWHKRSKETPGCKSTEATRGLMQNPDNRNVFPIGTILANGYAVMSACYCEISPDPYRYERAPYTQNPFAYTGVFELWGARSEERGDDIAALGAWGWALSRGLDLAERIPELDAKRSIVTGWSRLGKAALVAGARDERFRVVAPIQTGGGGCPLLKRDYGENTSTLNRDFTHWFCPNFVKYAEEPWRTMPFDVHLFLSCIAPRTLLVMGFDDRWYDTEGEYLALKAASPVWRFLGKDAMPDVPWPDDYDLSAVGRDLGYVRRDGTHGMSAYEWKWIMDFAGKVFEADPPAPVPLDGAWEMAYSPEAWNSAEPPAFKGVVIEKAFPGFWEEMMPQFRAAGMADDFKGNSKDVKQTLPIQGQAADLTIPGIEGCFFYRRKLRLDGAIPAALSFDCVRNSVSVWVNGVFAGRHDGFSVPFDLPIPDGALAVGDNEIVLAVSNNPNRGYNGQDVSGLTTRALFAATGGIDGRVELRFVTDGICDAYVTTAGDLRSFTVHVGERGTGNGERFAWEILDGGKVLASGEAKGDFTVPTDGFEFWSPENPVRYELSLTAGGRTFRRKFGIRRLVADGEKLRLNGRPVYLRGVTEHCYFPLTVHPPRDIDYYRMVTAKRKELGFNFVRFHTWVPPEEYLEAMDELGMLVHIESPNFVTLDEYAAIVRFARRHPCVVIYCTGNETWIDARAEEYLKNAALVVHGETDALFSPMSAMRGVEYMLGRDKSEVSDKPFAHNPGRMARLAAFSDLFTSYQRGDTSYRSLNGRSAVTVDACGDAYCGKPRLSHEICIDGSFMDLSLEKDYPENSPISRSGLFSEVRRQLEAKGLLDRAETYARNSAEWMRRIRKFTFEKVHSMKRTAGFDFLGDINTHWHTFGYSVGMMDEFYRLKPGETAENVRRYNSAAVLLTDLGSDFNVAAGGKKRVAFSISNFAGDVDTGTLRVELVEVSRAEAQSRRDGVWSVAKVVGVVRNGEIAALGEFDIEFPAADAPEKYLLRSSFTGGAVTAENEWELYAFPSPTPLCASAPSAPLCDNVRIVNDISRDELLLAMERGERVLLLGKGPFKGVKTSYRIGLAGRCGGNYATVLKENHPALDAFPHEGFCGWQFRRLMEGAHAVQLEADVPFDPVIDVASSDKFTIRQSLMFEYRVGEGRLFVCPLNFRTDDPAAAWLKSRLEMYAATDAFAPEQTLSTAQLAAVIDAPLLDGGKNANNAFNANDPANGKTTQGEKR